MWTRILHSYTLGDKTLTTWKKKDKSNPIFWIVPYWNQGYVTLPLGLSVYIWYIRISLIDEDPLHFLNKWRLSITIILK